MHLIQIFLPLFDNQGNQFSADKFSEVRQSMVTRYGGVTIYKQAASGLWENESGHIDKDTLIVMEVIIKKLHKRWWKHLRQSLEKDFQQNRILIRALPCSVL
jgi:hypothetical protein